jgi:hypothetical protein
MVMECGYNSIKETRMWIQQHKKKTECGYNSIKETRMWIQQHKKKTK